MIRKIIIAALLTLPLSVKAGTVIKNQDLSNPLAVSSMTVYLIKFADGSQMVSTSPFGGGGGATPGAPNLSLQFNNSGLLSGTSWYVDALGNLTYEGFTPSYNGIAGEGIGIVADSQSNPAIAYDNSAADLMAEAFVTGVDQFGYDVFASSPNVAYITTSTMTVNGPAMSIGAQTFFSNFDVQGLQIHANNAAAIAAGLIAGDTYRTGTDPDQVAIVH